jgi:phosphoribosyl 1,2-cyclic phosphodiesterase
MSLDAVPAQFEFHEVEPGVPLAIGSFAVTPIALNHPFGAVGYRLDCDGVACAYVSDTAPFDRVLHKQHFLAGPEALSASDRAALMDMRAALVARLVGVDTAVYDTHFTAEEYAQFPHYGHSTPDHGLAICAEAGVRRLVLYHHAPSHTDEQMDRIAEDYLRKGAGVGVEVLTSFEGMTLPIGPEPPAHPRPRGSA